MAKDACYHKIKGSYQVFPSARASQALAKCRKESGDVRKSEKGAALKRWTAEKWTDQKGKPCGSGTSGAYCRPTRKVSSATPKTRGELSSAQKSKAVAAKKSGKRAPTFRRK
jgi:hypothetical protein